MFIFLLSMLLQQIPSLIKDGKENSGTEKNFGYLLAKIFIPRLDFESDDNFTYSFKKNVGRPDLNGQYKQPILVVNWPALCEPFLKRPTFPGPATRQTNREMAGQLTDRPCGCRPAAKRFKKIFPRFLKQFIGIKIKFFFLDRFVAGRSAHGRCSPHSLLKFDTPFHGRSVSWPRLGRQVTVIGR
ncbi:hypothetical protein BpHYR1_041902 [Brachionus plicatilis]|uniref:Uncharacterized protein n=1 Tax=Brachionus plicatilis TaxID=10195 RepID=A0A3M7S1N1_BRAPC|nr:hypothetical protein BpHYR1_041902 [Brachionus plicatilis]